MSQSNVQLHCVPYSGGSALSYSRWRRLFSSWIEVRPLELPGRGTRMDEPLVTDPHRLAEALADEMLGTFEKPYALFGHSLGAIIAFELIHALLQRGAPLPLVLFASGTEAPSVRDDSDWRRPRSDDELVADLRAMRGTPAEVFASPELMGTVLPVLRADFLMCGAYVFQPRSPLPCPIHAFGGTGDDVARKDLEAWRRETASDFSLDLFAGGHFFINESQAELLGLIERDLAGRLDRESRAQALSA